MNVLCEIDWMTMWIVSIPAVCLLLAVLYPIVIISRIMYNL